MSVILPLIEEAIDVRLMDIKNISKLIYSYIEYDEYEGPQYDIFTTIKHDKHIVFKIFIIDGKLVPTWNSPLNKKKPAERHGITINGQNYIKLRFEILEDWFHEKSLNITNWSNDITVYQCNRVEKRFRYFTHYCSSIKAIKEGSRQASNEVLYSEILEPFVDFWIEQLEL